MHDVTARIHVDDIETFPRGKRRSVRWMAPAAALLAGLSMWLMFSLNQRPQAPSPSPPAPRVTVSKPLQVQLEQRLGFLGQFSAVNRVELRAQVGGVLTEIHFKDGAIVHEGDLLFVIDPRPYEVRLAQANAQFATARSRVTFSNAELSRAQSLKRSEFATQETVDQRVSDHSVSRASVDDAEARIRDAQLDLEYARIPAPFTGRIGARQVSIGGLIAGSRAGTGPTTLLATLVSLDPIYLDFDMSESDYLVFARERERHPGPLADKVLFRLSDETTYTREGVLDFVDNALDRSSGTIHARATVPNPDLLLAPGQFARLRLAVSPPAPTLMVPDAAVVLDQSQQLVMTVNSEGVITPKIVQTGDLRGGLREVRVGLSADDRVIIGGLVRAAPGAKAATEDGTITFDSISAVRD
jgi:multidrug efflux system membrane fusion protein